MSDSSALTPFPRAMPQPSPTCRTLASPPTPWPTARRAIITDPGIAYLQLAGESATVTHLRSYDTHGPVSLLGGRGAVWKVVRQREWDGAAERRAQD
jgi:hypothetical protein